MAFGVVGWDKNNNMVAKNDPNYVRWELRLNTFSPDTGKTSRPMLTHICNETDWSQFYQPNRYFKDSIQELKKLDSMICFDDG